jgi:hypothetical protein
MLLMHYGYALRLFLATSLCFGAATKIALPAADTGITLIVGSRRGLRATRLIGGFELVLATCLWIRPIDMWAALAAVGFFGAATVYVCWLRALHPNVGCGCSGRLSVSTVDLVSIAEAIVMVAASISLAAAYGFASHDVSFSRESLAAGIALSVAYAITAWQRQPHRPRLRTRGGGTQPADCATSTGESAQDSLARIRRSKAWQEHLVFEPDLGSSESWRQACWRYFAFSAKSGIVTAAVNLGSPRDIRVAFVPLEELERASDSAAPVG